MRKLTFNFATLAVVAAMAAVANAQPGSFIDLGNIGAAGTYIFDTVGTTDVVTGANVDTELGIWDMGGTLLAANDDFGGTLFSQITIDLTDGMYFLGVSEFNSVFGDGFVNTGDAFEGGDDANVVLNINGAFAGGGVAGSFLDQETLFFKVTVGNVIPEPTSAGLLALGLVGLVARRRR